MVSNPVIGLGLHSNQEWHHALPPLILNNTLLALRVKQSLATGLYSGLVSSRRLT